MPIYHRDVLQYSSKYDELKLGLPTSSNFSMILTPEGRASEQWQKLAHTLISERILGIRSETYQSPWMARGMEFEDKAAAWYAYDQGVNPEMIGFVTDDDRKMGCTPDRLIGEDGLLEIKVPSPPTQVGYVVTGLIAHTYKPQLQGQLMVAQRKWVDILGYQPPRNDGRTLPNVIIRVERDEDYIEKLAAEMEGFTRYVDLIMERLTNGDEVTPADRRTLAQIRKPVRTLVGARPSSLVGLKAQLQASLAHEDKARPAASAEAQREEVVGDSAQPRGTTAPGEAAADIGAASPLRRGRVFLKGEIRREHLQRQRDRLFVFGDNMAGKGLGGQAKEMRGEPNAVGIPTKWKPDMSEGSFFSDADWDDPNVRHTIVEAFDRLQRHLAAGGDVVMSACGVGGGRAELPRRAPKIFASIERGLNALIERASADPLPSLGGGGSAAAPRKADPPTEVQQPVALPAGRSSSGEDTGIAAELQPGNLETRVRVPPDSTPEYVANSASPAYHQASGPAEDEENFWTIASRTGDYRADIPDKNIATAGRDQMMNLVRTAPSLAAMRAFYKANEERLDVMSSVRLMSRAEVMKAFDARKKHLGPGLLEAVEAEAQAKRERGR